jgi:endoglucanase
MKRLVVALALIAGGALAAVTSVGADPVPLSISIVGNHFVDGSGQTIRLLGVDEPGTEYACYYGYDPGEDAADAAAIAAWHANAVRIPLNEDCWLGLNNEPSNGITDVAYRQSIENYVADLNADGIYAILDLHWTAPGTTTADGQRALPDDHSAAFWTSVATTFEGNPAVVFDAFNEPFSPGGNYPVDWSCWKNGGCDVPASNDQEPLSGQYTAVGMQAMVNAIRATGATQPIMLGGLSYANDLTQWLTYEPTDTLATPQLAASFHNYEGETCDDVSCWNSEIAPVAAQVPVVTGEFDEKQCDADTDWDDGFMNWADQNGVSYLAWGWWVLTSLSCDSNYWLISDASGTPSGPNGTALHDHLAALYAASQPPPTTTTSSTTTTSGGVPPSIRQRLTNEIAKLLRSTHSPAASNVRFDAPTAGVLTIRWSRPGSRHRRPLVVATDRTTFPTAGTGTLRPSLTGRGRRLLRHDRHVRLSERITFAERGGPTVTRTASVQG